MKTKLKGRMSIAALFSITAVFFLTCDNPVGLGAMLDLEGPIVEFKSPAPRQALLAEFDITGVVSDKSGVDQLLLTVERTIAVGTGDEATYETVTYAKQWRYAEGKWEVSENNGDSWAALSNADGPPPGRTVTNAAWSVPIDMRINGSADDGIYLFKIQAWDSGGFTGDSSTKTLVLIVDQHPPKVSIIDPYIYKEFSDPDLVPLHTIAGNDKTESRKSSNMGLFMTRSFDLKWQIDDEYDIGSVDIIFCEDDTPVDGLPETPITSTKIYYIYHEELPKPNGLTRVPNLDAAIGKHQGKDGEIIKPTNGKTTIKVVGVCKDAAGNPSDDEEKTLGYFVYWPMADEPWIEFPERMDDPVVKQYFGKDVKTLVEPFVLMAYPGRSIKPAAYQAHGVSKVRYALYQCEEDKDAGTLKGPEYLNLLNNYKSVNKPREVNNNIIFSTNFTWEIIAPDRPGYYVVKAIPYDLDSYDANDKDGRDEEPFADLDDTAIEKFTALFRVQDISFPEFLPGYPYPSATDPLFQYIGKPNGDPDFPNPAAADSILISGKVDDALKINSLLMVWINPDSRNYSAMSQLRYFSDPLYVGWTNALNASASQTWPMDEGEYDSNNPNKVWKITLPTGSPGLYEDPITYRQVYTYSQLINLATLNIGTGANQKPLESQMFLLRAQNPDGKATIISYAPQGDAAVPTIKITNVQVSGTTYTPGQGFSQVPQFLDTDSPAKTITINGTWTEDSTEFLNRYSYFFNNMKFTINDKEIGFTINSTTGNITTPTADNTTVSITSTNAKNTAGTFTVTATVGTESSNNKVKTSDLRDTLVVNVSVRDYGGNPAEDGASWLIESDKLRFLRISSPADDRAYRAGASEAIKIFIEFNKPVVLKSGRARNPVLLVNSTGGTNTTGIATYDTSQISTPSESTRHYFTYTPATGDNTDKLNVTGISIAANNTPLGVNATDWQNANYPFTFVHTNIENKTEEIRLTRTTAHVSGASRNGVEITSGAVGVPFWARVVPVSNSSSDADYIYTLGGGKAISVDTTLPTITGFTATPAGWHKAGVDLYITATFSEPVKLGTTLPRLNLGYTVGNTTTAVGQTSNSADDVRVNNNQITFKYTVAANNNTNGNPLRVTAFSGDILDIPGNRMTAFTATTLGTNAQTYLYLDTAAPATPTIAVFSGTIANPGSQITGTNNALGALYDNDVFIRFTATGATGDNVNLGRIEYSLNGGQNWTSSTAAITDVQVSNKGSYQVSVRQTDQAGNPSTTSATTTFNWDPGTLITRISSTSANGTYTHNTGRNSINVTVTFRKPLTLTTAAPAITINARTANLTNPTTTTTSLSFTYTVANGDNTPTNEYLDVTNISGFTTVKDGDADVNLRYLNGTGALPTAAEAKLAGNKQIKVETGNLTATSHTFVGGTIQPDGSYPAVLNIVFNHNISKNTGEITIAQSPTNYRLPAVLTESQYNRFRGVTGFDTFDTYYTKGTNGFNYTGTVAGSSADTSVKYVLNYQYNPDSTVTANNSAFTGDTFIPAAFFTAFRNAEEVKINVNAAAVTITGNNTLRIDLSGSNAPQVPGATYVVSYPNNLVTDALDNNIFSNLSNNVDLGGVARPFVRIRKTQDTITAQDGTANNPRLVAAQPFQTYARMDSRTPGSTITYSTASSETNVTDVNWGSGTSTGGNGKDGPDDTAAITIANRPGDPATAYPGTGAQGGQIAIGTANTYQGYQWWIRTRAAVGTTNSTDSDEVAFRTVITYRVRAAGGNMTAGTNRQVHGNGDQVWIRGGDAIGASSVPGFPFTWEDNWNNLSTNGKRAGIRLMTKVNNTTSTTSGDQNNLVNSTWKFVTWEINTTAYIDFILGHDTTANNTANNNYIWQYGPAQVAYQADGWTSFKDKYPVYPGKHRWCDTGQNISGKGAINYSGTFSARPTGLTVMPGANTN